MESLSPLPMSMQMQVEMCMSPVRLAWHFTFFLLCDAVAVMKATMSCLGALVLPLPAYAFVIPSVAPPLASTKIRHSITRYPRFQTTGRKTNACHDNNSSSRKRLGSLTPTTRAALLMTHAVSMSSAVGSGESIPAVTTKQDVPGSQELSRSNLGLHLKVGSKVINL